MFIPRSSFDADSVFEHRLIYREGNEAPATPQSEKGNIYALRTIPGAMREATEEYNKLAKGKYQETVRKEPRFDLFRRESDARWTAIDAAAKNGDAAKVSTEIEALRALMKEAWEALTIHDPKLRTLKENRFDDPQTQKEMMEYKKLNTKEGLDKLRLKITEIINNPKNKQAGYGWLTMIPVSLLIQKNPGGNGYQMDEEGMKIQLNTIFTTGLTDATKDIPAAQEEIAQFNIGLLNIMMPAQELAALKDAAAWHLKDKPTLDAVTKKRLETIIERIK